MNSYDNTSLIKKLAIFCSFSLLLLVSIVFTSIFAIPNAFAQNSTVPGIIPPVTNNINQDQYLKWFNQGANLLTSGNYNDALTAFNNAVTVEPDNYTAWF